MIKKTKIVALLFLLLLCECRIYIVPDKYEMKESFIANSHIKPSILISNYTGDSNYLKMKNCVLVFYSIGCEYSYSLIYSYNLLFDKTKDNFDWLAFTIFNKEDENKSRHFRGIDTLPNFQFKTYYDIKGLRSYLKTQYFNNDMTIVDYSQMNMVIENDSIIKINFGAVNTEKKYNIFKQYLDSVVCSRGH